MNDQNCSVIIVTHNSEKHIHKNIACLNNQSRSPDQIIIVDSGSSDVSYLDRYRKQKNIVLVPNAKDIGFCCGNNMGMTYLTPQTEYVLFLNPDAFLTPHFLQQARTILEQPSHTLIGALTSPLFGYDIDKDQPSGTYDSTGIFTTWYGRWYDRDKGRLCSSVQYEKQETVPAICGALMFCRKRALDQILIRGSEVFDSAFYMYKDDIDLSLRLRKKAWQLLLDPKLKAYHCRGWNQDRQKIPRQYRLMSARNELRIHLRERSIGFFYSLFKYGAVGIFDI